MFIGDREFRNPRLKVPAKLVIARINKRVYSRVSMIGQVRVSNIHLRTRLEEVNMKMRNLNELYSRMDEVDITCTISNTEKTSNVDKYISLNQEYLTEKFGQYPNHHRLLKTRRVLEDEDKALSDIKKKIDILQHISQETQREIDAFQEENAFIAQENSVLKPRLESVRQVPTIIDYAYTIKQTKFLQHEIEKWTKRVNMVEVQERESLSFHSAICALPRHSYLNCNSRADQRACFHLCRSIDASNNDRWSLFLSSNSGQERLTPFLKFVVIFIINTNKKCKSTVTIKSYREKKTRRFSFLLASKLET